MKNNIAFLYSNNYSLSCLIAREVSDDLSIDFYNVEDRAAEMLMEEGPLKNKIIELFGEDSYKNGKFNVSITEGLNFATSPKLTKMQNYMNDLIITELNHINHNVLVVSNEIIETGILHLSNNLIVANFKDGKNYGEYISIESIKEISAYFIDSDDIDIMTYTLRGCLIDSWNLR